MEEWFTTGAADGFNIMPPFFPNSLDEFNALVVPELQRRGLYRTRLRGHDPARESRPAAPREPICAAVGAAAERGCYLKNGKKNKVVARAFPAAAKAARRRQFAGVARRRGGVAAMPFAAGAQRPVQIHRIGMLLSGAERDSNSQARRPLHFAWPNTRKTPQILAFLRAGRSARLPDSNLHSRFPRKFSGVFLGNSRFSEFAKRRLPRYSAGWPG